MPESSDAERIRHDALEEELEAARRKRDSYQALLKDLPEVFEGKFRERIRPLQQRHEELLQESLALREQIRRALPEPPAAGNLPPAVSNQPQLTTNPTSASQPATSAEAPLLDPPALEKPALEPLDPPATDRPPIPPASLNPLPASSPASRLERLRDTLDAAINTLSSKGAGLRPTTLGAGLGLALLWPAALALADALMTLPGGITPELRAELRQHFTDEQLLEITVDVMKWNYQKVSVALGVDAEVRPGELTPLLFDEQGHWVRPT